MKILTNYVHLLNQKKAADLANLFAEDCVFLDKAPRLIVGGDVCIQGRESVQSFFKQLFMEHAVAAELLVDMGDRALYNVTLDRTLLRCCCLIRKYQDKIQSMEISLR